MPLKNYKLLIGKVQGLQLDSDASPHLEILVQAKGETFRVAVNVRSDQHPHDLLYRRFDAFAGPTVPLLEQLLEDGVIDLRRDRPDLAFDYQADDLFERNQMSVAPYEATGPDNDLKDFLLPLLQRAISDGSRLFAFGETWPPETQPDAYFHFTPGQGIHDIHMNQGSTGSHAGTNGPKQDGALLLWHPDGSWTAVFLAFQSQVWGSLPIDTSTKRGSLSIVAALVNAPNPEEGRETVSVFNRSDSPVALAGWKIRDRGGRAELLGPLVLGAGEVTRITLSGQGARLGNDGGEIHLVAPDDALVHSVRYDKSSDPEGWSLVF